MRWLLTGEVAALPRQMPPMATRGSGLTATGLALTAIAVSAGVSSAGDFALLLSFAGVLAGASLIFVGVRMADDDPTAPIGRRPGALAAGVVHCLRRNLAHAGLLLASCAVSATTLDGETDPVLCFCAFLLLLLGMSLVNIGVLRLREQEHVVAAAILGCFGSPLLIPDSTTSP